MLTFKEFMQESPELDYSNTKGLTQRMTDQTRKDIIDNHKNSEKIGKSNEGTYHKVIIPNNPTRIHYYHMVSGEPRELSVVKDNTQYVTSKGNDGNSIHNKWLMKYHASNAGELKSYQTHTQGSKKLWSDLVKENDPNFSVHHVIGDINNKMDKDYLSKNEHSIWNKGMAYRKHILSLKPNV